MGKFHFGFGFGCFGVWVIGLLKISYSRVVMKKAVLLPFLSKNASKGKLVRLGFIFG